MNKLLLKINISKYRRGLVLYSILLLSGLIVATVALILFQPASAGQYNSGVHCSNEAYSGAECNSIGNPREGHMWGCYDPNGNGSTATCWEVNTNDVPFGYLGGCFYAGPGNWRPCECNITQCENNCRAQYANSAPGHYTRTEICSGCKQEFTCGCDIAATPTPTPTDTPVECPYSSTQARVQQNASSPWAGSINIVCGESFNVGSFHNGTGQFAGDTTIRVFSPNGSTITLGNGQSYTTSNSWPGLYRVEVTTNGYNHPNCEGTASAICSEVITPTPTPTDTLTPTPTPTITVTPVGDRICTRCTARLDDANVCEQTTVPDTQSCPAGYNDTQGGLYTCDDFEVGNQCPVAVPGIEVEKRVISGAGPYQIGETVRFRIVIGNTGQTTLSSINFTDEYNNSRLDFLRVVNAKNGQNITSGFSVNEGAGVISSFDLTNVLGDLQSGQNYRIDFLFRALAATNRTCNEVFVIPEGGKNDVDDRACVSIERPPITDL
ncbi:MAG: hypothetical protein ACE5DX_01455 [Candidatus Dojkabacteria bacterium]